MKVTVDPGSKSTFSMVHDRTADMVSHTKMLNGVSLFLLGIVATNLFRIVVGIYVGFQHRESLLDWLISWNCTDNVFQ